VKSKVHAHFQGGCPARIMRPGLADPHWPIDRLLGYRTGAPLLRTTLEQLCSGAVVEEGEATD